MEKYDPTIAGRQFDPDGWVKASYSGDGVGDSSKGSCVLLQKLPDGRVGMTDSKLDGTFAFIFTPPEIEALILGAKAGEFDRYCQ